MNPSNPLAPEDSPTGALQHNTPEAWSAWMDGEADPGATEACVAAWKQDPRWRQTWSDFHRIGDVARSSDLALVDDDEAYLAKLRARMALEPVLLAPQPALLAASRERAPAPTWQRVNRFARRFAAPIGIAAGVAMVSSAVWVLQPGVAPSDSRIVQNEMTPLPQQAVVAAAVPSGGDPTPVRAVEFEPYLSAHKQFQPSNIQGPSSGFLRSAVYESPR